MTPNLIDTHCHLHFGAYDDDRKDVLARMREKNIWAITIGTNAVTSKGAINLAESEPDVFASVGFHPANLTSVTPADIEERDPEPYSIDRMKSLADSSKLVVGIGEIGLDYHHIDPNLDPNDAKDLQKKAFIEQVRMAADLDLPIIIHCRDAFDDLITVLRDLAYQGIVIKGVVHCFTENWERAQALLDVGLHLSFTGIVTFKPRTSDDPEQHVHRVIERMPLERIMVETDAPWLSPEPFRGKRNEPAFVEHISDKIAELRGISPEEAARATTENAIRLFSLPE